MRNRPIERVAILLVCAGLMQPPMLRSAGAQSAGGFNYRIVAKTPCYKSGPMQGRPPDAMLPAGTAIRLVSPAAHIGSYVQAETRRGLRCWIIGDAFRLLGK